jgi:sarcosine oxidase
MAYYEHPDYVPLLRRAYDLWHELEADCGQKLLYETGGVYMGPPDGHVVSGALRAARQHGLAHEALSRREIARRFPQFRVPDDFAGIWEPRAGFLLPEKVIATQAEGGLRAGAQLHGREPVLAWHSTGSAVAVRTAKAEYHAGRIVFCGGPWTAKLVGDLGVQLVVTRQVLGWVWPRRPELFELGTFPVWGIEGDDGSLSYGFPLLRDNPGLKVARHGRGQETDPDRVKREATEEDEAEVRQIVERNLPDGNGPTLSLRTCLYTNSPDGHFVIDAHPAHANVILACGFSGHGFKFASVIGEVLADLATRGMTDMPVGFLALQRFEE